MSAAAATRAPSHRAAPSPRLPQLDSVRGLAALFVVFHHACLSTWGFPAVVITPAFAPWVSWLKYGHYCVTLFIVLSGFVIMRPLVRQIDSAPNWRKFFARRSRRILPPYYAALACSVALFLWYHGWRSIDLRDLAGHALLIHDWGVGRLGAFNGPMWSIPVEWHIYFTVPLLFLGWRRFGLAITTIAVAALGCALFWALPNHTLAESIAPHYYGAFAIGGAAAWIASRNPSVLRRYFVSGGAIMALAVAGWAMLTFGFGWNWYLHYYVWGDLAFAVVAGGGLIWLAECPSPIQRLLQLSPLVALGEMSYSLYLVHGPLLAYANDKLDARPGIDSGTKFLLLCGVITPIIVVAAYVFHRLFERPFLSARAPTQPAATGAPVLAAALDDATQNVAG